jgi:hypothetical protein
MRVVMMVVAAVPRARSVTAAARVLRAALVIDAEDRVLADTLVAGAVLAAVPIVAALGANASLGIPVLTADESVTAIELIAAVAAGGGGLQETAIVAEVPAAIGYRRTDTRIADLAVAAVAICAALGAVTGLPGDAALQSGTAFQRPVLAGLCLGNANVHALTQRHAFVIAAFLALAAFAEAGPLGAIRAIWAGVGANAVDAGLAGIADDTACATVLIVRRIEVDAVDSDAVDITAGFAWRATALDDFANPADAIDDGASIWLDTGRNAGAVETDFASRANDTTGAAIHAAAAQVDTVDPDTIDITAGGSRRTIADLVADIVDTGWRRANIGLTAVIIGNALYADRVVRIVADEEAEVAATIGIGAADGGAGAAFDISTADRPIARTLPARRLRPCQIETRSDGDAANHPAK